MCFICDYFSKNLLNKNIYYDKLKRQVFNTLKKIEKNDENEKNKRKD